jgi:hypothetical protein
LDPFLTILTPQKKTETDFALRTVIIVSLNAGTAGVTEPSQTTVSHGWSVSVLLQGNIKEIGYKTTNAAELTVKAGKMGCRHINEQYLRVVGSPI